MTDLNDDYDAGELAAAMENERSEPTPLPVSQQAGHLLNRVAWNALCAAYAGPKRDDEVTVTVRGTSVDLESHDGVVQASVHPHRDATDVRVGDVQILVAKNRVAVVMRRGPFPIKTWEVLWEGDLSAMTGKQEA